MGSVVPAVTGLFRTVVERSSMANNDEWVRYTDRPLAPEDSGPARFVFSRPVYAAETDAGLVAEDGSLFNRREPEITRFIDAVWRVRDWFPGAVDLFGGDVGKAIVHRIAYNYYDCMSGGMPKYVVSLMRWACEEFGVPGDTEVYPGPDRWNTISDFLADTADAPDIRAAGAAADISRRLLGDGAG